MGLSERGHRIAVLAPAVFMRDKPVHESNWCEIKQPKYISFSNIQIPLFGNTVNLSNFFKSSVSLKGSNEFVAEGVKPDIVYAKFFSSALSAQKIARYHKIPWVLSVGESILDYEENIIPIYTHSEMVDIFQDADGIEAVSDDLGKYITNKFGVPQKKVHVIPNAVDTEFFKQLDRNDSRIRLGLERNDYLVCYVGADTHNKGARRVLEAVHHLQKDNHNDIGLLMLGKTEYLSKYDVVKYSGTVKPDEMPLYMAASNIFVLPTTNEGMCNSILEAMSAGLPIISSDLPFNHEIINTTNGILIDPLDVGQIADAILRLKNDKQLTSNLSRGARQLAELMDVKNRIRNVEKMLHATVGAQNQDI